MDHDSSMTATAISSITIFVISIGIDIPAASIRWSQFARNPSARFGFQRVRYRYRVHEIALGAFKDALFFALRRGGNPSQHHTRPATGTIRTLDWH
jgi:hypothetical protein